VARLVVVSNRVSALDHRGAAAAGGLAMAISTELSESGGLWFGWSGETVANFSGKLSLRQHGNATLATVDLDAQDVEEYYNGFANATLWPLCHYRIDLAAYDRSFSTGYARVNARLAHALCPLLRDDDLIWAHDYHLVPLASELRRAGITNRIGFFLHIPWPPAQIMATMPRHHEFVRALFDYDLIGFQTEQWQHAFLNYVREEVGGTVHEDGCVELGGQKVRTGVFPIGIDVEHFRDLGLSDTGQAAYADMTTSSYGRGMIVGVDRIDYTKGLLQKFAGYGQFLEDHPDKRGRVFMLQIGQPSRPKVEQYASLRSDLEAAAGRINGEYGTRDWVPLRYIAKSHSRDELAGIFRAARAALVTPVRDGMNLVSKEYVAAQDPDDPGVLILSRFAGAATQMRQALLVNPYSREDVSDALARALSMPRTERIARWQSLFDGLVRDDLAAWRHSYVAALKDRTHPANVGPPAENSRSHRKSATAALSEVARLNS
jgi:trehalose 6-phosphate synthase